MLSCVHLVLCCRAIVHCIETDLNPRGFVYRIGLGDLTKQSADVILLVLLKGFNQIALDYDL